MDDRSVGFFDSGIGGLSCVEAFRKRLPEESLIYYSDELHAPYGDRTPAEIASFSDRITAYMVRRNVKLLMVACNTVSSLHLPGLRADYPELPIVGTIEPTAEFLAAKYPDRDIGVIATRATVASGTYTAQLKKYGCRGEIYALACPDFVPMIEAGVHRGPEAEAVIRRTMDGFVAQTGIEVLVLGCTHYPFIEEPIRGLYPRLELVDPAELMAARAESLLRQRDALASPDAQRREEYYTSAVTPVCRRCVERSGGTAPVELRL